MSDELCGSRMSDELCGSRMSDELCGGSPLQRDLELLR
jgi:hypothetical protein